MIVCFTAGEHPLRTIYAILPVRGMRKDSGCEKFKWFPGTLIERRERHDEKRNCSILVIDK